MNRRSGVLALTRRTFLAATTAALAAVGSVPNLAFAQEPVYGGTLTLNVGAEPPVLVSAAHTGAAMRIGPKVVEGLLAYDLDFNPIPQLATEWSVSDDGLVYTFKLRQGVKWHDGEDFTAEDVAFSILSAKQEHPRGRGTFANITETKVVDDHTVEVVLSRPAPYLLKALAAMETPILPRHIFEGKEVGSNPALNTPIGTGPFVFKEWIRGSHVLLERNPDYWDEGKPYVDQLIIRFINDPAAAVAALETGETLVTNAPIPLPDVERLVQNPNIVLETRDGRYNNSILRGLFNLDRPYLQDVRVRQAIAHAFDRQFILDTVYLGHADPLPGPVSPTVTEFFYPELDHYGYDPAKAEALLDEAGYPRGSDGTRFEIYVDPMQSAGPQRQIAEYIAQALDAVGIRTTVRTQDFATFVRRLYTDRDFDFAVESMSNLFDPTVGIQRLYWSENIVRGVPFSNGAGYVNEEVDRLLVEASGEIDPERRYELFADFQKHIVADLPSLGLAVPHTLTFHDARVHNVVTTIDGVSGSWSDVFIAAP